MIVWWHNCLDIMVRLQSQRGNYYEFDPRISLIEEDAFGKYYRGVFRNASGSKEVRIYEVIANSYLPEYMLRRLRRESQICYSHPNIIPVIDFVVNFDEHQANDCRLFFIEEYISGISLSNLLDGQINASEEKHKELYSLFQNDRTTFARKVTKDILHGLDFFHEHGIYIKYIETDSIIITDEGIVKIPIKDFFMYDILCYIHSDGMASTGLITLISSLPVSYLSPEIISKYERSKIDNRSDIYSVGILFYHLLTGHIPYKGNDVEIMSQHLNGKMPLHEIEEKQMRKIIKKATEKDPHKRFQSAIEFINAIDKIDEDVVWYKKLYSFFGFFRKKKRFACIFISILVVFLFCTKSYAQNNMRINYKDGSISDVPIECIDSITFVEKDEEAHEVSIIGEWLWGSKEKGYYEMLAFNEDRTYTGYDYYLEYGFDTWTYGTYMANGIMLNLWSNGYGYSRTYRWFVTGLTENALEVMTQMGGFIYYRIQPEVYSLKVGEKSYECKNGDYYVFTDGVKVLDDEGKLKGVCEGTTYILKYNAESGLIMAYKVKVEKY